MLLFLAHASAVVTSAVLGRAIGSRGRAALAAGGVTAVLTLGQGALRWRPDLAARLFPWSDYPLLAGWYVPLCVLGLSALACRLPRRSSRRVVGGAALLVTFYGLWAAGATFLARFNDLTGKPDRNGFCRQTSRYSCGAAALCTWLAHLGVPSSERELARLSATQWHGGVSVLGLRRAARMKLVGRPWKVRVRRLAWEDLEALPAPCVVAVRYSLLTDHFVTVLRADEGRAVVADPLARGIGVWAREELEARWRGVGLVAEPDAPPASPFRPGGEERNRRTAGAGSRPAVTGRSGR